MNFKLLKLGSNTSLLIKIGTITINTFLPTRSKFVYFCSIKTSASGFNKVQDLNKHFLPPAGCVSIFHTKSCLDARRSCSQLMRDQVNMADAAKLCSPLHSTSDALVVWHGQVLLWRRIGPFLWPVSAAGVAIFSASHWFAEHISHMYWFCQDSDGCSGLAQQQTTKQWPWPSFFFFWCKFGFGKCFGASSQSNYWASHHRLSYKKPTFHHRLQSSQEMICCCCTEEKTTLQDNNFFDLRWGEVTRHPQAFSPFQFASNARQP